MIPFGPFHPDVAGVNTPVCRDVRNVMPGAIGFTPLRDANPATNALSGACLGAVVIVRADGAIMAFAGDATKLYKLSAATWNDVSRTVGGTYAATATDRWRFAQWGSLCLATNFNNALQKFDLTSGTNFQALGGSPPRARYLDIVRDQVLLGGIAGNEMRVQWSGINDAEFWTPGSNSSDYQSANTGGPITGVIGGAQGYVFQRERVTRMTFTPSSAAVYQFDEVQGGRGLVAPHSLVKVGDFALYLSTDGFYKFDVVTGSTTPIGENKWRRFFQGDMRSGTFSSVVGAQDPLNPVVMWSYISKDNATFIPDRLLIYNWKLEEATVANVAVEAVASWITSGVTLDTLSSYGTLDSLPYSLDSLFWKGGNGLFAVFGSDHRMGHLQGQTMEAIIETADALFDRRMFLKGTLPLVDTPLATVAIAARERDGDNSVFEDAEAMEDTGVCPAHVSGNLARARITIPAGASWSQIKGLKTLLDARGRR